MIVGNLRSVVFVSYILLLRMSKSLIVSPTPSFGRGGIRFPIDTSVGASARAKDSHPLGSDNQ